MVVNVASANRVVKEFVTENGMDLLPNYIVNLLEKHSSNSKLTVAERYIVGLRYSEFVDEDGTETSLWFAETTMKKIVEFNGIDRNWLMAEIAEYGWK